MPRKTRDPSPKAKKSTGTRKNASTKAALAAAAAEALRLSSEGEIQLWPRRFEDSIDKLAAATTDLSICMSALTQRLDYVEQQNKEIRDHSMSADATSSADTRNLRDKVENLRTELTQRLDETETALTRHFDASMEKYVLAHEELHNRITTRLDNLEIWRWLIVGGSIVVGAIFAIFVGFFGQVLVKLVSALDLMPF